jgi:hypothetical protein
LLSEEQWQQPFATTIAGLSPSAHNRAETFDAVEKLLRSKRFYFGFLFFLTKWGYVSLSPLLSSFFVSGLGLL